MKVYIREPHHDITSCVTVNAIDCPDVVVQKYMQGRNAAACCEDMRLVHQGRSLVPYFTLSAMGVTAGDTLELVPRLRGGGGDGGSTGAESRSAYLAMYQAKRPDAVNPEEERLARWTSCNISGMPLHLPIVCDEIGNLYNKDAAIHALIEKTIPKQLGYITSLKHLIDLKVDATPGAKPGDITQFSCPLTGLTFNGKNNFVVIRRGGKGPGYVFSERALKEAAVVIEETVGGKWQPEDVLKLVPVGDDLEDRRKALAEVRDKERAEKKAKKARKAEANGGSTNGVANGKGLSAIPEETANGGDKSKEEQQLPPVAKKSKIVDELMPVGADPTVWNSLFGKKEEIPKPADGKKKYKNNDYMVRAGMKYI